MSRRKVPLAVEEIYHVFTRSIAEFHIFRNNNDYLRMQNALFFYTAVKTPFKLSVFMNLAPEKKTITTAELKDSPKVVKLLTYCLMPTHVHLVVQQLKENGISKYMNLVLKSYTKYFNLKYKRMGPLWEGRFKNVHVETEEQFLHLTRYIHLNPVTAFLVDEASEWIYSSYAEYVNTKKGDKKICDFIDYFNMDANVYKVFVRDGISYQRELKQIKHLLLE